MYTRFKEYSDIIPYDPYSICQTTMYYIENFSKHDVVNKNILEELVRYIDSITYAHFKIDEYIHFEDNNCIDPICLITVLWNYGSSYLNQKFEQSIEIYGSDFVLESKQVSTITDFLNYIFEQNKMEYHFTKKEVLEKVQAQYFKSKAL